MKILFVDHAFHRKTKSSNFFADLLATRHHLEWLYVDPNDRSDLSGVGAVAGHDLVVLWQMDYLAPLFISQGVRTVVVPMFDGSSLMPDLHWLWSSQARFVNFSRRLHDRVSHLQCKSMLVKYFLPPVPRERRAKFENGLKVLLWQRRPEHGINLALVENLFGAQLNSVHVHDAPDDPDVRTEQFLNRTRPGYRFSTSTWFESREDFDRLLDNHNVLVAPRMSEGIGMAMLEGLARGMLVIANDAPTHDEYIANWINGVLFDPSNAAEADFSRAAEIGDLAWHGAVQGHARWVESELDLLDFIEATEIPNLNPTVDLKRLLPNLVRSYFSGLESYSSFLHANLRTIEQMSRVPLAGFIDEAGTFVPTGVVARSDKREARFELSWLDQNRLEPGDLSDGRFLLKGKTLLLLDRAWVVGERVTIGFRIDPTAGASRRIRIRFVLPEGTEKGVTYCLSLNDVTLGISVFEDSAGSVVHELPAKAIRNENELTLTLGSSRFISGFDWPVSLGIERIEFF